MRRASWVLGLLLGLGLVRSVAAAELRLFVSPRGQDTWSGRLAEPNAAGTDGPVATVARVRDLARQTADQPVTVLLRGGVYALAAPLVFGPDDARREGAPVVYTSYPGERATLSGGRRLSGFTVGADGRWTVTLPTAREGRGRFEQLWVNGRRAVRARTPNRAYHYMVGTARSGTDPLTGRTGKLDDRMFVAGRGDLAPLANLPTAELQDAVVASFHSWHISRQRVAAVKPEANQCFLFGSAGVPFFFYTNEERYYLENLRSALDEPGEWFLDRTGTLTYLPRPGEDPATAEVVAPVTDTLVAFQGTGEAVPVRGITLRGLRLAYAGYWLPADGASSPQAACTIAATVMADQARDVALVDCVIEHTGSYGVWFREGCRDSLVQRCLLQDLGAGGVRLGQTAKDPKPTEVTSHIRVDNNIIRQAGAIWPDAIGVLIGHSGDNQVTHNDISGIPYSGISVGWRWGYGKVASVRNQVRFNHIHHLGQDVLADMGGIYTLGEAPGTVLANNVIHAIDGDGNSGMHGLYNDNSTSDMLLENNLVYDVRDGAYQLGSGRGNVLRNNVFIGRPEGGARYGNLLFCMYYPKETHRAATIERNIFYGGGGKLFQIPPDAGDRLLFRNNLYYEPAGAALEFIGLSFDQWRARGQDAGSQVADPKFVDARRLDFRLQPDSPAVALGFQPIDYAAAGVYGDAQWQAEARAVQYPPCVYPPPPPPMTFAEDFESVPVGEWGKSVLVGGPAIHVEHKGDAIDVTEETAAGGRRCLKITDAPGLQHDFNPHFFYSPKQHRGVATLSFDLRVEASTKFYSEWRQYPGQPYYHTGPRIEVRDGQLLVAGLPGLPLPAGQWVHLEMTAGLGPQADGTWTLQVTLPGQPPRRLEHLKCGSPQFKVVTWLGFVSEGSQRAVYYLDNLRLTNTDVK